MPSMQRSKVTELPGDIALLTTQLSSIRPSLEELTYEPVSAQMRSDSVVVNVVLAEFVPSVPSNTVDY
jgi:hypothetical protein